MKHNLTKAGSKTAAFHSNTHDLADPTRPKSDAAAHTDLQEHLPPSAIDNEPVVTVKETISSNHHLPLAQKYQAMFHKEAVLASQKIMNGQRKATAAKNGAADVVVNVSTCMKGNPGPGAYGRTVETDEGEVETSDYCSSISGYLLDLEAMVAALRAIREQTGTVQINTTAESIVRYLNDGQVERWRDADWRKSGGKRIQHAELWAELLDLYELRGPNVVHARRDSTPQMRKCHSIAAKTFRTGKPVGQTV